LLGAEGDRFMKRQIDQTQEDGKEQEIAFPKTAFRKKRSSAFFRKPAEVILGTGRRILQNLVSLVNLLDPPALFPLLSDVIGMQFTHPFDPALPDLLL